MPESDKLEHQDAEYWTVEHMGDDGKPLKFFQRQTPYDPDAHYTIKFRDEPNTLIEANIHPVRYLSREAYQDFIEKCENPDETTGALKALLCHARPVLEI